LRIEFSSQNEVLSNVFVVLFQQLERRVQELFHSTQRLERDTKRRRIEKEDEPTPLPSSYINPPTYRNSSKAFYPLQIYLNKIDLKAVPTIDTQVLAKAVAAFPFKYDSSSLL